MNKTQRLTAIVAGIAVVSGIGLMLAWPHVVAPQIPYQTADSLMLQISNDATTALNDPSMRFRYPLLPVSSIGTLVRPDSRGGFVDAKGCLLSTIAEPAPAPSLFPAVYKTNWDAAASISKSPVFTKLAAKFEVGAHDVTELTFEDIKVAEVGENDILDIAQSERCQGALRGRRLWIVRGYVLGKRKFSLSRRFLDRAQISEKTDEFNVNAGSGDSQLVISDKEPMPFMELVSVLDFTGSKLTVSQPAAVVPSGATSAPPQSDTGRIYLQLDRSDQSSTGKKVLAQLSSQRFHVENIIQKMKPDQLPNKASVRYFNNVDKPAAVEILKVVRKYYPDATAKQLQLAAPVHQVEIWFPAVSRTVPLQPSSSNEPKVKEGEHTVAPHADVDGLQQAIANYDHGVEARTSGDKDAFKRYMDASCSGKTPNLDACQALVAAYLPSDRHHLGNAFLGVSISEACRYSQKFSNGFSSVVQNTYCS